MYVSLKQKLKDDAAKRRKVIIVVYIIIAALIIIGGISCAVVTAGAKGAIDAPLKHFNESQQSFTLPASSAGSFLL